MMIDQPQIRDPIRGTNIPAQLSAVRSELLAALNLAIQLTGPLSDGQWRRKSHPARWSIGECLVHLNLTSEAFLPRLREAIEHGRRDGLRGDGPFRCDFRGWLMCRLLEPPYTLRVRTPAAFVPAALPPKMEVMGAFERLQRDVVDCLHQSAGLDLARLTITSPFAKRTRYNLYSAFRVIAAHQRRHLWQAEQVRMALSA